MMRDDYARQGLSDIYSQEILNVPLDITNAFFKKSDFIPMKASDLDKKMIYYATCDLAVSTAQRSDFSAFVVGGVDEEGRLNCIHVIRERLDAIDPRPLLSRLDRIEALELRAAALGTRPAPVAADILMLQKVYQPTLFGIEAGTIQKAIGPVLNEAMVRTGIYINRYELKPSADKLTRARSIQARMRSGACRFNKDSDWYLDFEDELLKFPRDKHDDQVDAWAYLGLMVDKMWSADTQEEQEEEEYEYMVKRDSGDGYGRSAVTGY